MQQVPAQTARVLLVDDEVGLAETEPEELIAGGRRFRSA